MIRNKCLFCGSFNLRADRALSGRLICTSCGNPYGVRKPGNDILNPISLFTGNKKIYFIFLLVVVFLLVII